MVAEQAGLSLTWSQTPKKDFLMTWLKMKYPYSIGGWESTKEPEDHWSCIAHLSTEDMLKSAIIEEKKFKHSPRVGADNLRVDNFSVQVIIIQKCFEGPNMYI